MNLKKYLLVLILLLMSCGCSFRYEIDIVDDQITEKRTMLINNSEVENNDVKETIRKKIGKYSINDDMMIAPSSEIIKQKNMSGYQVIIKYELQEYRNSDILNMCYKSHNTIVEDEKIYLTTGREFTCFNTLEELDNVEIVLKTNHEVENHNADKVDNNVYTWYINRTNASNKPINIEIKKHKKEKDKKNTKSNTTFKIVFISIVAIFSIVVIIMLVIKRKRIEKLK